MHALFNWNHPRDVWNATSTLAHFSSNWNTHTNIKQICRREKHSRKNSEKQEYGWHLAKCIKCYVLSHKLLSSFNKEEGTTILKFQHSRATIIGKLQNLGKWKESATSFCHKCYGSKTDILEDKKIISTTC